jgi:hypothetical protein
MLTDRRITEREKPNSCVSVNNNWLGRQSVNQTFEQDDSEWDVQEIRELLQEDTNHV